MKQKKREEKLQKRRDSYDRLKASGGRLDAGPRKRLDSGGYIRPGSLKG